MSFEGISFESESSYSDYDNYQSSPSSNWEGRSVNIETTHITNSIPFDKVVTCGERCHGEVSADFSVSSDGSKSAEVEVELESEDGKNSGYVSGEVSQDKDGDTSGKVEAGYSVKF
jgi:outer membrane usher protein FimD/PapC